ncbi:MAG: threonylcarbamoyl-AMP synthase [Anaerolineae bacterium]|nr:threonylcarbamoyl-AMP synthase [Anaerolineae bacterium]
MKATRRLGALVPQDRAVAVSEAVAALRAGELVVFPTDTVYGVACDPWREDSLEALYWAKQRPRSLAIPLLVSAPEQVVQAAWRWPASFSELVSHFWPGGLTVILPKHGRVPAILSAGHDTVAVRMPDHPLALEIIAQMGGALAVSSANLSGKPSPSRAEEAWADLQGRVALVLDGGPCPGGVASSIVDLSIEPPVLLRSGALQADMLRRYLPNLRLAAEV